MSHGTSILDGFIGPCVHGRDPYDRCEGCGQLTPAQAEAVARAETFPTLTRERARAWLGAERTRIADLQSPSDGEWARRDLILLARNADRNPGSGDWYMDALADLLVDAAAGRVR